MNNPQKWFLTVAVWLITIGIFVIVLLNRYTITTSAQGNAYKLDRFTGKVTHIFTRYEQEVTRTYATQKLGIKNTSLPPDGWEEVK